MGSGVQEWCLLAPSDPRRREPLGVVRGASQIAAGRRQRIDAAVTIRSERSSESKANNLGFRCVIPLER